jgi:hypothetical protein
VGGEVGEAGREVQYDECQRHSTTRRLRGGLAASDDWFL